jgi:uncharacterized membrane protein
MTARRDQNGMVTALVVSITAALLLFTGLVLDGGYLLAARRQAIDEAEGAARAAAQAVAVPARGRTLTLDPARAQSAVDSFLAPTGHRGVAAVDGDVVTVTVSFSHRMVILGLGGLAARTVTGKGTAHVVRGIKTAEAP